MASTDTTVFTVVFLFFQILAALSLACASPVPGLHIHTGGYGYRTVPYQDVHYSQHVHAAPLVQHVHSAPLVHTYPAPVVHTVHSVHSVQPVHHPVVTSYKVKQHYHLFGK